MRTIARQSVMLSLVLTSLCANAQVLLPAEIKDPAARRLQQTFLPQLKLVAEDLQAHQFPYPFYFSRVLDIDEDRQQRLDQRSIRFEKRDGQTVLIMTGNYYAAYSADLMDKTKRVRKTMNDVVVPLLKAAVPRFANDDGFAAFGIEISHHVRREVMGVAAENPENVVFMFPRAAAQHLVTAKNDEQIQAALLDSEVFVDAEPFNLWVNGERPSDEKIAAMRPQKPAPAQVMPSEPTAPLLPQSPDPTVSPKLFKATDMPVRLITPRTLTILNEKYSEEIARVLYDLKEQAHFVQYAPPTFVGFHEGAYLQFSITTPLDGIGTGSRYKLAALAFDDHVSHLIRPVLAHFQQASDFDGIVFSSSLRQGDNSSSEAIEYFFPLAGARSYARYDCTGQQLLDSGFVLINGERAELNLQLAEADGSK
jgi:hypothetical protein